jgi:tRNA threonylcarbamoyladenosine biosynthesis protein TsaB
MTFILNLETSTTVCSVSVSGDGKIVAVREQFDAKSHASQLIPFITEVLNESGLKPQDLSAIAVSKGPGSYTGLRIGVSTAKGLGYALKVPIIALDTLFCMASGYLEKYPELLNTPGVLLCPMIDARRMEVYSSVYNTRLQSERGIKAEVIEKDSFNELFQNNKVHFFGDGAMKCKELILNDMAHFQDAFNPSSNYMGKIAYRHFQEEKFEDLAYFEPFYLKDFVATVPVNKMA